MRFGSVIGGEYTERRVRIGLTRGRRRSLASARMPRRDDGDLNAWWWIGLRLIAPVVSMCFRLRVVGAERVPAGAAVLAGNHVSALDGVLLAAATGSRAHRMTRFLVAAEFLANRRVGWALRLYRQIPLRRGAHDAAALDEAVSTVAAGALAGIFPEGKVNPDPSAGLQRGHTGVARIALAARAPVVPVGLWGTQERWPLPGLHLRRPLRPAVAIVYGEAIPPTGQAVLADDVQAFTDTVMRAIEAQVVVAGEVARR
jgi:1-acyl-sn-glycerol-3-phosphate acyltransferase